MIKKLIPKIIFSSRFILIPFYFGLMITMVVYTFVYTKEIIHLFKHVTELNKEMIMLTILEIVDIVMIANLVKMIITGSYHSFVDKEHGYKSENNSSGMLKVKMGSSLIGVSSIHLLQTFINIDHTPWDSLYKQLAIHSIFLVGTLVLSVIDYLHCKSEGH